MDANPFLGVVLHAIGGLAAASFYIPLKKVRQWGWESYWLANGVFSWLIAPAVVSMIMVPDLMGILRDAPPSSLLWCFVFGVLWGMGGLTFGLSMRYLGMSLGYALALGFCAAFGTIIPPIFQGTLGSLFGDASGLTTLAGVVVCLGGIAVCGVAGMSKEKEMPDEQKKATIREFNFRKGVWVAVFCGIMSACMAFGIAAGEPIAKLAVDRNVAPLWQNTPVFVVIFAGGFLTNFVWCMYLNGKNQTFGNYTDGRTPLALNYFLAALAGIVWYCQFMFYGMGSTQMVKFSFSSWTLHMAFIIIFSNVWGLLFLEWKGSSGRTRRLIFAGIVVLIVSTMIVGLGNYLGTLS